MNPEGNAGEAEACTRIHSTAVWGREGMSPAWCLSVKCGFNHSLACFQPSFLHNDLKLCSYRWWQGLPAAQGGLLPAFVSQPLGLQVHTQLAPDFIDLIWRKTNHKEKKIPKNSMQQLNSNGRTTQQGHSRRSSTHWTMESLWWKSPPKKANARNKIQSPSSSFNGRAVGSNVAVILREPCETKQASTY